MNLDDPKTFYFGLCLIVGVVVLFNLSLVAAIRGKKTHSRSIHQLEILRRAGHSVQRPWEEEDRNLAELSRQVAALKGPGPDQPQDPQNENSVKP